MKKWLLAALGAVILAAAVLCAAGPAQRMAEGMADLPPAYRQAIEEQAAGVYSARLPLVPMTVTVERWQGDRVYYTVRYFPFGRVGMSYGADGYNMEQPLSGLS